MEVPHNQATGGGRDRGGGEWQWAQPTSLLSSLPPPNASGTIPGGNNVMAAPPGIMNQAAPGKTGTKRPRRSRSKRGGGMPKPVQVAPFLEKTFTILSNVAFEPIVSWNETGDGIIVKDIARFAAEVLPLYFKHRRWTSFVRQLHIYGFRKWGERRVKNQVEFRNPQFLKTGKATLHTIKRRVISNAPVDGDPTKPRPKRRRRVDVVTTEQAQLLMVAVAKQQEVLQRIERLEAANQHLAHVNDCLAWELLRLRRRLRKPTASVCESASQMCRSSGIQLVEQLQQSVAAAAELEAANRAGSRASVSPRSVASSGTGAASGSGVRSIAMPAVTGGPVAASGVFAASGTPTLTSTNADTG